MPICGAPATSHRTPFSKTSAHGHPRAIPTPSSSNSTNSPSVSFIIAQTPNLSPYLPSPPALITDNKLESCVSFPPCPFAFDPVSIIFSNHAIRDTRRSTVVLSSLFPYFDDENNVLDVGFFTTFNFVDCRASTRIFFHFSLPPNFPIFRDRTTHN